MLLTAVSSRCFSSVSRCCVWRCCCDSLRTTRNSKRTIASTEAVATAIRMLICSRQSASAADVFALATITMGNLLNVREEISRSLPSIGLVRRDVLRASSNTFRTLAGPWLKFFPTIASMCG